LRDEQSTNKARDAAAEIEDKIEQLRMTQFENDKTKAERDAARMNMRRLAEEGRTRDAELEIMSKRV
jgi:predicted nucleic acid-binding protein